LETAGELHDRLSLDGAPLVLQVLDELATGRATETPQDESRSTLAGKLSRESAVIEWNRPAEEIARRIRGLYPWPGCRVRVCDLEGTSVGNLRLVRARPGEAEGPRWSPGEVMANGLVQAGDVGVELVEVQPDGGKPMPLADYRRGHRWVPGLRLEPA
jgi:methionyl-tRNA formyltransferase